MCGTRLGSAVPGERVRLLPAPGLGRLGGCRALPDETHNSAACRIGYCIRHDDCAGTPQIPGILTASSLRLRRTGRVEVDRRLGAYRATMSF
jgi:hypothetical protein